MRARIQSGASMFGKNPIRPIVFNPKQLAVESIFYTIQGEGPFAGMPSLFIRLAGCNLACHFCDTQFETQADNPQDWEIVANRILAFPIHQRRLVVVTGGEPMRQNWAPLATTAPRVGDADCSGRDRGDGLAGPDFNRLSTNPIVA
jgi:7-carboxy-7-deazaguanine synthase